MRSIFRYVPQIESLDSDQLKELGYYKGFVCAHGHEIRDIQHHWCYQCTRKIQSNICGFDVNYLHSIYKVRYQELWSLISTSDSSVCWENKFKHTRKNFPSYRNHTNNRWSENVNIHKLIYQCAWGDVGNCWVTRRCSNRNCFNPLHLTSEWNVGLAPKSIEPFCKDFVYEKLMLAGKRDLRNLSLDVLVTMQYKKPIPHPKNQNYEEDEE